MYKEKKQPRVTKTFKKEHKQDAVRNIAYQISNINIKLY